MALALRKGNNMSNKVQDFIRLWKEKRSLKALIGSDLSAADMENLRAELAKLGPAERKEAKKVLTDVSKRLVRRIKKLNEKRENLSEQIEHSKKTKRACLAYSKQEHISIPHEQRRAGKTAHKMNKIQEHEKQVCENLKSAKTRNNSEKKKD
ncbi:MAG: hypothetical protein KAJ40_01590 [Alphaproteobacteria bacterium]|nr:hypothetical protein [Alphaproteobacteria bacterium]